MSLTRPSTNLYKILGLTKYASKDAIKSSYLNLMNTYSQRTDLSAEDEENLRKICFAHELLLDEKRRSIYDKKYFAKNSSEVIAFDKNHEVDDIDLSIYLRMHDFSDRPTIPEDQVKGQLQDGRYYEYSKGQLIKWTSTLPVTFPRYKMTKAERRRKDLTYFAVLMLCTFCISYFSYHVNLKIGESEPKVIHILDTKRPPGHFKKLPVTEEEIQIKKGTK
ncbi:DnaJ [Acrasis kona]|uniref:DnaJ n=1 Tax=Acrasis kona TaxID=1008807 RepID=A0AAW2ZPR5_9EUKA